MIHERLHLRSPIRQILHLIKEQIDQLALLSPFVEGIPENHALKPATQRDDGHLQCPCGRHLVELEPEDPLRAHALLEQMADDLLLKGCLANLSRPAEHRDRRESVLHPLERSVEQPAPEGWQVGPGPALPPRIGPKQVVLKFGAHEIQHRALCSAAIRHISPPPPHCRTCRRSLPVRTARGVRFLRAGRSRGIGPTSGDAAAVAVRRPLRGSVNSPRFCSTNAQDPDPCARGRRVTPTPARVQSRRWAIRRAGAAQGA